MGNNIYLYPFVHIVQKSFHGDFYMAHHLKSLLEHLTNILLTTQYGWKNDSRSWKKFMNEWQNTWNNITHFNSNDNTLELIYMWVFQ